MYFVCSELTLQMSLCLPVLSRLKKGFSPPQTSYLMICFLEYCLLLVEATFATGRCQPLLSYLYKWSWSHWVLDVGYLCSLTDKQHPVPLAHTHVCSAVLGLTALCPILDLTAICLYKSWYLIGHLFYKPLLSGFGDDPFQDLTMLRCLALGKHCCGLTPFTNSNMHIVCTEQTFFRWMPNSYI